MPRAIQVGERILVVRGGNNHPVFLCFNQDSTADPDRGDRGVVIPAERELYPRPTFDPVGGELITRQSTVLKLGDYRLEIAGSQVSASELADQTSRLRVNGEYFRLLNFETKYVHGYIAYYIVYVRGVNG